MFRKMIDAQYRHPSGLLGRWIGRRMAQQHVPENVWTVDLLNSQPGNHILEIGFGPGLAIERLAAKCQECKIAGIDASHTMVSAARKRNERDIRAGRVDLHVGDVLNLPFEAGTFDCVYSIHSIYFWPEPQRALREIFRVMKSGATLILTLLPAETPEQAVATPEFKSYSGAELAALLSGVGFVEPHAVEGDRSLSRSNFAVVATR